MKLGIYFTLGDQGLETSLAILRGAAQGGASLLEVGLPFSDPLLDGSVILESHTRALAAGELSWSSLCEALRILRKETKAQISVMTSSQLLYTAERRKALPEVDGLLVTDLAHNRPCPFPLPSPRVWFLSQDVILGRELQAPPQDVSMVYLTRVQGITGEGQSAQSTTPQAIEKIRRVTDKPVWLGFGITTAKDVKDAITDGADGAIIGSAFVRAVTEESRRLSNEKPENKSEALEAFSRNWVKALLA